MHEPGQKFEIPQFRSFVPEWLRPWIVILFVIIVQFSGGVYLAATSEMVGTTQLLNEDIMMAGYASLVGMALFFGMMFRVKFAVKPRTTLLMCGGVIAVANLVAMNTTNVPLLVGVSFVAGFFRMWATFECNSTIQLWLTPKRDLSVFFCYVYLIVNSAIQLSGIATIFFSVWASWHFMHYFIVAALLVMMLLVMLLYKDIRVMPHLPLYGIDWLGMIMWGITALSVLFVCLYGEHYDWWYAWQIRTATLCGVVTLAMNLWRASFIRHPYIMLDTLKSPIVPITIAIMIIADVLLAPSHIFEHALMAGVLGYDAENLISLNWVAFVGTIVGVLFTWLTCARRKWSYQRMLVIAFSAIALYLAYFYFVIDYNLPKEALYFPIFVRTFGYIIVAVAVLTSLTRLPFPFHFMQGVMMQNLFSASLAGVIGTTIVARAMKVVMTRNAAWLSEGMDSISLSTLHTPFMALYGEVQVQALLETMKEIYGWLLWVAIAAIIALGVRYSGIRPRHVIHPTFRVISKAVRVSISPVQRLIRRRA